MDCCDVVVVIENPQPIVVSVPAEETIAIAISNDQQIAVVVESSEPIVVSVPVEKTIAILVCEQGPAGPTVANKSVIAAETISAYLAVAVDQNGEGVLASADQFSHGYRLIGIAKNAADSGMNVVVANNEHLEYSTWNWNDGLVFLGLNGTLTQSIDSGSLFSCPIGWGSGNTLMIRIGQPIFFRN